MKQTVDFGEWFDGFKRLAEAINWPVNDDDPAAYREGYDNGLSPEDMLSEEIDAAR